MIIYNYASVSRFCKIIYNFYIGVFVCKNYAAAELLVLQTVV